MEVHQLRYFLAVIQTGSFTAAALACNVSQPTLSAQVAKLEDERAAGAQTSQLNTARLAPGVYLYFLEKDYGGGNPVSTGTKKFVVQH